MLIPFGGGQVIFPVGRCEFHEWAYNKLNYNNSIRKTIQGRLVYKVRSKIVTLAAAEFGASVIIKAIVSRSILDYIAIAISL